MFLFLGFFVKFLSYFIQLGLSFGALYPGTGQYSKESWQENALESARVANTVKSKMIQIRTWYQKIQLSLSDSPERGFGVSRRGKMVQEIDSFGKLPMKTARRQIQRYWDTGSPQVFPETEPRTSGEFHFRKVDGNFYFFSDYQTRLPSRESPKTVQVPFRFRGTGTVDDVLPLEPAAEEKIKPALVRPGF